MLVAELMTSGGEMRYFLLSVICMLLATSAPAYEVGEEGPAWFKQSLLDIREDIADAKKSGRHLMLYFYMDGCPYCARFQRETLALKEIASRTRKHFDVVAIDLRGSREVTDLTGKARPEKDFAAAMDVKFTPTFLVFDEAGGILLRLKGFQSPAQFDAAIDYIATAGYRLNPDFDTYLKARAAQRMLQGERFDVTK
jgi:thioredoxin-related protein